MCSKDTVPSIRVDAFPGLPCTIWESLLKWEWEWNENEPRNNDQMHYSQKRNVPLNSIIGNYIMMSILADTSLLLVSSAYFILYRLDAFGSLYSPLAPSVPSSAFSPCELRYTAHQGDGTYPSHHTVRFDHLLSIICLKLHSWIVSRFCNNNHLFLIWEAA